MELVLEGRGVLQLFKAVFMGRWGVGSEWGDNWECGDGKGSKLDIL
jgi:hypothetical protein